MPIEIDPRVAASEPNPAEFVPPTPEVEAPVPVEGEVAEALPPDVEPPQDILTTFSADEIADLAINQPDTFNFVEMLKERPDLRSSPEHMAKMTEAYKKIRSAPWHKGLPGPEKVAGTVKDIAKSFWANFKNIVGTAGEAGALGAVKLGMVDGVSPEVQAEAWRDIQKKTAEEWAAIEGGMTGLVRTGAHIAESPAGKIAQAMGKPIVSTLFDVARGKPVAGIHAETPVESELKLQEALAQADQSKEIKEGKGALLQAVGGEVLKDLEKHGQALDPEKVAELEAADPFTWYTFGKAMQPLHMASAAAAKMAPSLDEVVGKVIEGTAAATKPIAKAVVPAATAVTGSIAGHAIPGAGAIPGVATVGGAIYGWRAGKGFAQSISGVADVAKQIGAEIAGTPGSAYTALAKGALKAAPMVARPLAEGTAMDLGLAAAAPTPAERQGVGLGAAFGLLGAAKAAPGAAWKVLGNQLIGPRSYSSSSQIPSSGRYSALDSAHSDSFGKMGTEQRGILNSLRFLLKGASAEADLFAVSADEAIVKDLKGAGLTDKQALNLAEDLAIAKALADAGVPADAAEAYARQRAATIKMPDGRSVAVVRASDVSPAAHETRHIFEKVLGEQFMQEFDQEVIDRYGVEAITEAGQRYGRQLGGGGNWMENILNGTGRGERVAVMKLVEQRIAEANQDRASRGEPPLLPVDIKAAADSLMVSRAKFRAEVAGRMEQQGLTRKEAILEIAKRYRSESTAGLTNEQLADALNNLALGWDKILTPEEQQAEAISYMAREIGAENFSSWFSRTGPDLTVGGAVPDKIADWIAGGLDKVGIDPVKGQVSTGSVPVPLDYDVAKQTGEQAARLQGKRPVIEPETAPSPAREASDVVAQGREIAAGAPHEVLPGANQSIKEMLGTLVQAMADKIAVVINYRSAPGQPAAGSTVEGLTQGMTREARRAIVEAWRVMPEGARGLVERIFSPERVRNTSKGYQVYGVSPQVVAANAQKLAEYALNHSSLKLPPEYTLDRTRRTFTPEGWNAILTDVANYSRNHSRGYTGSGERLNVPDSVSGKDYYAPAVTDNPVSIPQGRADIVAALFGYHTPENATVVKAGKLPLNIAGQRVSEATMPGRLGGKKAEFGAPEQSLEQQKRAAELGITGEGIRELNPFLEELNRRQGAPSFIEAKQWMNLEHMADVTPAPDQARLEQNTLTAASGFMPKGEASFMAKTEAGKDLEKRGLSLVRVDNPEMGSRFYRVMEKGNPEPLADLEVSKAKDSAHVEMVWVEPKEREKGLADTLYREMATDLQEEGIKRLTGFAVSSAPIKIRDNLFGNTVREPTAGMYFVENEIKPGVQFMPKPNEPKAIKSPAVLDKETGKPHLGTWHGAARVEWAIDKGMMTREQYKEGTYDENLDLYTDAIDQKLVDGFITNEGEFLNREQAYERATSLKQIKEKEYVEDQEGSPGWLESNRFAQTREFMPKEAKELEEQTGHDFTTEGSFMVRTDEPPKKTVTAYKLLRVKKSKPGKLFPLFANKDKETPVGVWLDAEIGKTTMAKRPGWHFGDLPDARHIGKKGPDGKINRQHPDTVWVEAELAADVDWQTEANSRAKYDKDGKIIPKTAHIVDEIPKDGYYRYKTNPNMVGEWMISGAMKIKKVLTDAEVDQILRDKGVEPLPREGGPMDLTKWGIDAGEKRGAEVPEGQFMARKGKEDYKLKETPGLYSKAWILPNGRPVQLGGQWHHEWVNENKAAAAKFGLKPTTSGEANRVDALKKGFARVNYGKNRGDLTVEARYADWPKLKDSVLEFVKANIGKIDSMDVHLLDKNAKKIVESDGVNLFSYDANEKLDHIPLITEKTAPTISMSAQASSEGAYMPKKGININDRENDFTGMILSGEKTIETRDTRSLDPYIGERVGLVSTGKGKATLVGSGVVGEPKRYASEKEFRADYDAHRVEPGSKFDFKGEKWGYPITEVEALEPSPVDSKGIVAREVSFTPKLTDPTVEKDVEKVRAGTFGGETYNADGTVWSPGETKNDVVTLASKNFRQDEITLDAVKEYLKPYDELLDDPGIKMGMFPFEQDGVKLVSVDVNAIVPQEHRENSLAFAKANDQVAIFDAVNYKNVDAGGKGNTKLTKTSEMLEAVGPLVRGEPVNIDEIIRQNKEAAPEVEQEALPGIPTPKKVLSSAELGSMTKAEVAAHFPESVIPKTIDAKIPSDILGSPLYKKSKNHAAAVKAFVSEIVKFARQYEKMPEYQAGLKWYSEFTPILHKVYGKSAQLMAELLAATSPNTMPDQNFAMANEAVVLFNKGAFKKQIAKFEEGLDMIKNNTWRPWLEAEAAAGKVDLPVKPTAATFINHWYDANDIAPRKANGKLFGMNSQAVMKVYARQWLQNTEGPKTQNFVQNLLGTGHEATIDVWADRTMRRIGYSGFKERWRILPNNKTGVSDPDFYFGQEVFRAAAKELGILPDALQGALWFAEKKLWADNGWGRLDLGDYRNEFTKVPKLNEKIEATLTPKAAEATPQGDLFVEPRNVKQ